MHNCVLFFFFFNITAHNFWFRLVWWFDHYIYNLITKSPVLYPNIREYDESRSQMPNLNLSKSAPVLMLRTCRERGRRMAGQSSLAQWWAKLHSLPPLLWGSSQPKTPTVLPNKLNKKTVSWNFPESPVVRTLRFLLQGMWIQSLVGALRSYMLCGVAKRQNN